MTQRQFDIENEKDMQDLWDILPDKVIRLEKDYTSEGHAYNRYYANDFCYGGCQFININWHDKTEITRPIQEASEADIGKLCKFWDNKEEIHYGRLDRIINQGEMTVYCLENIRDYCHCRRLTKQEIEELC